MDQNNFGTLNFSYPSSPYDERSCMDQYIPSTFVDDKPLACPTNSRQQPTYLISDNVQEPYAGISWLPGMYAGKEVQAQQHQHNKERAFGNLQFINVCVLCGSTLLNMNEDVVRCARKACQRGMHVACILSCCSLSTTKQNHTHPNSAHGLSRCRPTRHIYRTDTELCGLCHLFVREIGKDDIIPSSNTESTISEQLWHLRPNTSKTAEPLRSVATHLLRTLRVHVPTPKGVVVQAESYIWRVSAEAIKKKCKQLGLDGCSFRFSAAGFFEARLAAIVRFNQIVREASIDGSDYFVFPKPDISAWESVCARELKYVANMQRLYTVNYSSTSNNNTPECLRSLPISLSLRPSEARTHLNYPPGPILCVTEGMKDSTLNGRRIRRKKIAPNFTANQLPCCPLLGYSFIDEVAQEQNNKYNPALVIPTNQATAAMGTVWNPSEIQLQHNYNHNSNSPCVITPMMFRPIINYSEVQLASPSISAAEEPVSSSDSTVASPPLGTVEAPSLATADDCCSEDSVKYDFCSDDEYFDNKLMSASKSERAKVQQRDDRGRFLPATVINRRCGRKRSRLNEVTEKNPKQESDLKTTSSGFSKLSINTSVKTTNESFEFIRHAMLTDTLDANGLYENSIMYMLD